MMNKKGFIRGVFGIGACGLVVGLGLAATMSGLLNKSLPIIFIGVMISVGSVELTRTYWEVITQ